jgi:integrase
VTIQRRVTSTGKVRYRVRLKAHGREIASRTFDRRTDAVAWQQDQARRVRQGDWIDPRRGRVSLAVMAEGWLATRAGMKRRTRETDALMWKLYIAPKFGRHPIASITSAEVAEWAAQIVAGGLKAGTAKRALSTFRSILDHAVADERLVRNVAAQAKAPKGRQKREGQALTGDQVDALAAACRGRWADAVVVLAHTGMRWGELAGLQIGDRIAVPGPGLRPQRAALSGGGAGDLFIETLKGDRARTVPLTPRAAAVVASRAEGRRDDEWLFQSAAGTPLRENNWKRSVHWTEAKKVIGKPTLRVHDLRHTAASLWLAAGADVKVVQRMLGHASATMTVDLDGHLMDAGLWESAKRVGGHLGAAAPDSSAKEINDASS